MFKVLIFPNSFNCIQSFQTQYFPTLFSFKKNFRHINFSLVISLSHLISTQIFFNKKHKTVIIQKIPFLIQNFHTFLFFFLPSYRTHHRTHKKHFSFAKMKFFSVMWKHPLTACSIIYFIFSCCQVCCFYEHDGSWWVVRCEISNSRHKS